MITSAILDTRLDAIEAIAGVPSSEFLEYHALLPEHVADGVARVITWHDSVDPQALDDLAIALDARIELTRIAPEDIPRAIAAVRRLYGADARTARTLIEGLGSADAIAENGAGADLDHIPLDDLVTLANEAPVVRLVNLFLLEALDARASDVHLEQYAGRIRVRYRVDGLLHDVSAPPLRLGPAIVSRLKIMAQLDVAERRVPQDGRIRLRLRDRDVDVRVSTLPTLYGESLVLRLLDRDRGVVTLAELGMDAELLRRFTAVLDRPNGMVLVTGPTGSGKTTTLYAAIDHLRTGREKVLTVEDPVEYELEGVPQVAVNERIGLSFARALRALLRQDPDVLLVGEIRDDETAQIATHAALTGHLVLSTLHTNNAIGAITRLTDLGVPRYLVANTVTAVLAQRLVRRLCEQCRGEGGVCDNCHGAGYRGRVAAYELVVIDAGLRRAIQDDPDPARLEADARAHGTVPLAEYARGLVARGITSEAEILRIGNAQ